MRAALSAYAGPMPASRRADPELSEPQLGGGVDRHVPRHDEVGIPGDDEMPRRDRALLEPVDLADELLGSTTQPAPITQPLPG